MKNDSTTIKVGMLLQSQNVEKSEVKGAYRSLSCDYTFICLDCGVIFDEPSHWEERHGLDYGPFEKMSGCPCCGGEFAKTYRCSCCEEWIDGCYVKTEDDQRICEGCYRVMELGDED